MLFRFLLVSLCWIGFSGFVLGQQSPYGVNLSGMEWSPSAGIGTAGVNYFIPTQDEIKYYAGKGLRLIRLPFLWERVQHSLGGNLDPTYLGYIDNVVSYAAANNVSIILDVHNHCRYPYGGNVINTVGGPTLGQFGNLWRRLAQHFATQTAVWGYDLMNEPYNLGAGNYWQPMAQAAIDSIRKVDTQHAIIVEGDSWSSGYRWITFNSIPGNNLAALNDPNKNLVFQAHQYFDVNYSGQYTNILFSGNPVNTNSGVTLITPFVTWLKNNNLRGYVGEYNVPNSYFNTNPADLANWNTLLTNFMEFLKANCILGTAWGGGPKWNYTKYRMGLDSLNGLDASQMAVLQNYTSLPSTCSGLGVLPIVVTGFYTQAMEDGIQLFWQTTQDGNLAYVEVEKSLDGLHWTVEGRVDMSKSITKTGMYSFTDYSKAESPNSKIYYRLKQVSIDQAYIYSHVLSVGDQSFPIRIYPNPFSGHTYLSFFGSNDESLEVLIRDLSGNMVEKHVYTLRPSLPIEVGTIVPSGTYLIQMICNGEVYNSKLVKY